MFPTTSLMHLLFLELSSCDGIKIMIMNETKWYKMSLKCRLNLNSAIFEDENFYFIQVDRISFNFINSQNTIMKKFLPKP